MGVEYVEKTKTLIGTKRKELIDMYLSSEKWTIL